MSDISEDLCDHFFDQIETSRFAFQVDETTDVVKRCTLNDSCFIYVEKLYKGGFFCFGNALVVELHDWNCSV